MSKKEFYYQCILTRGTPTGRATLVTWVEEKFAVQGKRVCIKGDLAYPETDVWVITNVGMKQTISDLKGMVSVCDTKGATIRKAFERYEKRKNAPRQNDSESGSLSQTA